MRVIGREVLETRPMVTVDKGPTTGSPSATPWSSRAVRWPGGSPTSGPTFAKVTLISDASSTVVGKLLTSGDTGDVMGQAGGVLVMRNVDSAVDIGTDEEVFTAGLVLDGGIRSPYPPGLVVGSVVDVERDANSVVQTAFLAPAANLDAFEYALVITDYDGGLPPVDQQPVPCGENGTVPDGEVPCYTPDPTVRPTAHPSPKASPKR